MIKYINKQTKEILYLNEIVIRNDDGSFTYNITDKTAREHGWEPYQEPEVQNAINYTKEIANNSNNLTNKQCIDLLSYLKDWSEYIGKELPQGRVVKHNDRPWRARQTINPVLENQVPGIETAALYERIDIEHKGTLEDPIPYEAPMEIYKDKYYIEGGIIYVCLEDSQTALVHSLADIASAGRYAKVYNPGEFSEPTGTGTLEDPITWLPTGDGVNSQELIQNKYYKQDGVTYKATRDSGIKLIHKLIDLVGIYVEKVE